ncbi:MAG TPA: ABC transporter permease [Tissierellales bacterium]|nr:ABC transporter permease [Tissierellales bacterium]
MKISNMAIKNIKGNLYRYIMYYLSNSFAVTAFFIFANFVFHPSIDAKSMDGHEIAKMGATNGMVISQVIIVIFSIFFVGYSTSIFLKSRGKEFGLLSLYGMTRGQIKKYVLIENTIISIMSIFTGILTGAIFSKLFFMIMEGFLEIKLPFNISIKAIGLTSLIFFALFEIVNIVMLFKIKNKEIIEQLRSSNIPKTIPKFSKAKSILGVSLILIGYIVAWFVESVLVPLAMIPVTITVIIGTYFLFTQFSIAVANRILKSQEMFYKKTNMVAYSQMIFKLQDTAKVLFLASILGAITFTATGTIYSFFTESPRLTGLNTPQEMAIVQRGEELNDDEVVENIENILEKNNVKIIETHSIKGAEIERVVGEEKTEERFFIISNSDYNRLAKPLGRKELKIKAGEVIYNYPYNYELSTEEVSEEDRQTNWNEIGLNIGGETKKFKLDREIHGGVMALPNVGYFDALVLNDVDFENTLEKINQEDLIIYSGINIDNWKDSYEATMEIQDDLGDKYSGSYYSKILAYKGVRKVYGLILFIGFFIAFLFFIASGSIIYFKLFNEIKQDEVEYNILKKIGTTEKEINKIITKQIGIIFFLPFIVSTLHSFFALKSLSNLLMGSLFKNGLIVMLGYLVFQMIYFTIIRSIYINRIKYN